MQRLITGFYADAAREVNRLMTQGWEIVPLTIGVNTVEDVEQGQPKGPRAQANTRKVFRQVMWAVLDDGYELEDVEEEGFDQGQDGPGRDVPVGLPGVGR